MSSCLLPRGDARLKSIQSAFRMPTCGTDASLIHPSPKSPPELQTILDMSHHIKPCFPTKSKHLTTYRRTAACTHSKITTSRCIRHSSRAGISHQHKVSRAESCGIFSSFTVILACGMGYIKQRSEQTSIGTALSAEQGNLGSKQAFTSLPVIQVF